MDGGDDTVFGFLLNDFEHIEGENWTDIISRLPFPTTSPAIGISASGHFSLTFMSFYHLIHTKICKKRRIRYETH
jgi:hypothetical protein